MRFAVLSSSLLLFAAASAQVTAPAPAVPAQPAPTNGVSRAPPQQQQQPAAGNPAAAPAPPQQPAPGNPAAAPVSSAPVAGAPAWPAPASGTPAGAAPAGTVPGAAPSGTASGPAATHTVMVGGAGNKFFPDMTNVAVGDSVIFSFATSTHNVIQSDAKGGCTKSASASAFQFPQAGGLAAQSTTFTYTVPATAKNIWFYCAPHCAGGMTGGLLLGGAGADGNSTAAAAGAGGGTSTGTGSAAAATGAPSSAAGVPFAPDKAAMAAIVVLTAVTF